MQMRWAIHIMILLLLVVPIWGDPTSNIESIYPAISSGPVTDGLLGPGWSSPIASFFNPTSSRLEVSSPVGGTLLRRSLTQERVTSGGQVFNFGLRSTDSTEIGIDPFGRTQLSFSNTTETLQRLDQSVLSDRRVTTLGLRQGFGSDGTAGMLGLSRTQTSATDHIGDIRDEVVQAINLRATLPTGPAVMGLTQSEITYGGHVTEGRVTDIALPLQILGGKMSLTHHTDETSVDGVQTRRDNSQGIVFPFRLSGRDAMFNYLKADRVLPGLTQTIDKMDIILPLQFAGQTLDIQRHIDDETKNGIVRESDISTFVMPLGGGRGRIAYTVADTLIAGVAKDLTQLDVEIPLSLHEGAYLLERHDIDTEINDVQNDSLITKISGPIPLIGGSTADYTILEQMLAGVESETRTFHLVSPVPVLGRVELTDAEMDTNTTSQSQRTIKVVTPMMGQELSLQHQTTTTDTGTSDLTQVVTPRVDLLSGAVSMNARLQRTDVDDAPTQQVIGVDLAIRPSDAIILQGSVETRDNTGATEGSTQTLSGTYRVSEQVSLNARVVESDGGSGPPASDRRLMLTANPGDIKVSAGILSWARDGIAEETSQQFSLTMGGPRGMNLSAEYRGVDFDRTGMIVGLLTPVLQFILGVGDPSGMAVQLRYVDTPGRAMVERGIGLQFVGLGGTVRVRYGENTTDPRDTKLIRLARTYDLGIERKVFDNVRMNLGLRYCDLMGSLGPEMFSRIEFIGGDQNGSGEIKLSALTGDFVPVLMVGQTQAESTLDLSFTRSIGGDGRLMLTIRRAVGGTGDDTQGLLTYGMSF